MAVLAVVLLVTIALFVLLIIIEGGSTFLNAIAAGSWAGAHDAARRYLGPLGLVEALGVSLVVTLVSAGLVFRLSRPRSDESDAGDGEAISGVRVD